MQAQAADIPVKAMPAAASRCRTGGSTARSRPADAFFLNDPQNARSTARLDLGGRQEPRQVLRIQRRSSRAPFGNVWLSTGTSDGLYQVDFAGKNIGYDDQQILARADRRPASTTSTSCWDQSPHLYSTSAHTIYQRERQRADVCRPVAPAPATTGTARDSSLRSLQHDRHRHQARHRVRRFSLDADRRLGHPGGLFAYGPHRHAGRRHVVFGGTAVTTSRCRSRSTTPPRTTV